MKKSLEKTDSSECRNCICLQSYSHFNSILRVLVSVPIFLFFFLTTEQVSNFFTVLKILLIYFFVREGKRMRKRGRETLMCMKYINRLPLVHPQLGTWPATKPCAPSGNGTRDLSVHRPALSPLSHTNQGPIFIHWIR